MHCAGTIPTASKGVVVVADDDDSVRALIARILRGSGYTVLEARSSDEALAAGEAPDLLVADLVMPSTGGVELADAMRARIPGRTCSSRRGTAGRAPRSVQTTYSSRSRSPQPSCSCAFANS
jgi:CheY-like chemotaxis protein